MLTAIPISVPFLILLKKHDLKQSIAVRLKNQPIQTMTVSSENFNLSKNNTKEIVLNNFVYDILNIERNADNTFTLSIVYDQGETQLMQKVLENSPNDSNDSEEETAQQSQFSLTLPASSYNLKSDFSVQIKKTLLFNESLPAFCIKNILTPPPQSVA